MMTDTQDLQKTEASWKDRLEKRPDRFPFMLVIRMALLGISLFAVIYTMYKLNSRGH
jgi:hypothetical protein